MFFIACKLVAEFSILSINYFNYNVHQKPEGKFINLRCFSTSVLISFYVHSVNHFKNKSKIPRYKFEREKRNI